MFLVQPSHAVNYTIDQVTDLEYVGDFIVAGGADKSAPGQVFEV